jgi:MFS family permease
MRERLAASARSFAAVFGNRDLRRLQLAWAGSIAGHWSYLVALAVYAYDQGGAAAVGIVAVIRMIPAAVAAPFMSTLADRFPRRLVMIVVDLVRAALMCAAALTILVDGPAALVYAIVAVSTVVGVAFRPAQAALLPSLARNPAELTAANVASSTIESVGSIVGPALGGLLLAVSSAEVVFAVNALSFVWSAALVVGIAAAATPVKRTAAAEGGRGFLAEAAEGIRAIFHDRDTRTLVGVYCAQTLVAGALGVLVVVTALDVLELDDAGVGWLNAALGAGGLAGGFVALVLATRGRLAGDFGVGVALFGLPLALVAAWPSPWTAAAALVLVGIGNSITDVAALTILQRTVPDDVLGRVLGVLEGLLLACLGLGALLVPLLVETSGARTALLITGALLPAVTLLAAPRLRAIDRAAAAPAGTSFLRRVALLAPLPEPMLERLAASLAEVRVPAGETVLRSGEPGDRFYVIEAGEVEIERRRFGPGESFGEIALLRDVPRTATVTARTDVVLQAIERDAFIAAVTGHAPAAAAAEAVIAARLGSLSDGVAPA